MVTEVVTMKMISSTRKISVSGVMLMSANTPPLSRGGPIRAMPLPPLERRVDQGIRVDMKDGVDVLNLDRKIFVKDTRDDRDRQSQRGRNQRFGDTGCDDRE